MEMSASSAIVAAERKRTRSYSSKEKKFLKLYADKGFKDGRECARIAGYADGSYTTLMGRLSDDIKEIASAMLLGAAPQAVLKIIEGMEANLSPTQLQSAKEILDRVGIVKQEQVEHKHTGGIFLIPAKQQITIAAQVEEEEYIEGEYYDEEMDEETAARV